MSSSPAALPAAHAVSPTLAGWIGRVRPWRLPARKELARYAELAAGDALTLHVRQPAVLEVRQHGVWLTLSHGDCSRDGDIFLQAGDRMELPAGCTAVLEAHFAPGSRPDPQRLAVLVLRSRG